MNPKIMRSFIRALKWNAVIGLACLGWVFMWTLPFGLMDVTAFERTLALIGGLLAFGTPLAAIATTLWEAKQA
jgi:hypothetical protein